MSTIETQPLTLEAYASWDEPEDDYVTELVPGVVVPGSSLQLEELFGACPY